MARQTREEREQEVREQYEAVTDKLYTDRQAFRDFLSFSGKHYKLPADHAMMIFSSNPNADMVTDYDTWQKLGRQVTRGQKSMAAFENGRLRHYFDISQTEGKAIRPRWHFDKDTAAAFTKEVSALEGKQFNSITSCVDYFSDSQTYGQIANLTNALNVDAAKRREFSKSVSTMVRAIVAARCGYNSKFNYKSDPLDLSALDMLHSKAELEKLTEFIQINAKAVLLSMEKTVTEIQRRNSYEQGHDQGRNSPDMVRGGQQVLSGDSRGERQAVQARSENMDILSGAVAGADGRGRRTDEAADRAVRGSMAEVHGGELPVRNNRAEGQNEMGADTPADRQGSRGNGMEHGAGIRPEQSSPDNVHGDSNVGENEAARGRSQSDDRLGSPAQSINKTAEADTAPAVSLSDKSFAEQVDESLSGKLPFYTNLKLGDTPEILISAGLRQLPMLYTQKHLKDAVAQRDDNKHRHGLSVEQIKTIPEKLINPIMIYDSFSRNDSVVAVINDFDQSNNPIIVSIKPDGVGRYEVEEIESNFVTSIYSKENFKETFNRSISEDKLLYCDKKQTQEMFERWGLQLPELTNSLVFNTIIHQSRNIVKGLEPENKIKNQEQSERKGLQLSELTDTPDLDNSIHPTDEIVKGSDPENDLRIAADALSSYANAQLQYYNANVREAYQSNDRNAFNSSVNTALDNIISDVVSERVPLESFGRSCTMEQFMTLYKEMLEDQEYKDKFTSELADRVYGELQRLDEVREYAHANGIPFSETPHDPDRDENRSPYDYDGSMSVEDGVLAADANNLEWIMNKRSEELKSSAISFSGDEFNSHFTEQAEKALREYAAEHSSESWYKDMLNDPEHLKKVSNLVAPGMYNELREEMQQKKITYPAVYVTGSFQRNFDVQSVGFEIGKSYTVEEFNAALNKANEIWNNDDRNQDKLNSVNVSIYMDEQHNAHSYEVELYAMYKSIGEVIDMKPSIKPTGELSELKAAVSAIENPVLNSDEIPSDIDKFYVDKNTESVTWVSYNPESSAGGQFVYTYMSFDDIFEAMEKEDPFEYLRENCRQEVLDRGAEGFEEAAEKFKTESQDISSQDKDYPKNLVALTEPRYAIYQLKDDEDLREYQFSDSEYLKNHGMYVDRENYNRVYRGRLKENETLEDIYERFNENHPQDFHGHSLSVGDIVAVKQDGKITANFVDTVGFTEIPDFTLSREERKARRTIDNLNLLAEKQLSSDEMDTLGDKLFDYDNAPKYNGITNWTMGESLHADDFERLTTSFHNGENINAEIAKKIYGNMSYFRFSYPSDGVSSIEISSEKTDSGITLRTKGGYEVTHSWETLGQALLIAARQEFKRHEQLDREYFLNEAKARINEYSHREFHDDADFSDLWKVPLAYTTHEDTEVEVSAYADLKDKRIVTMYGDKVAAEQSFKNSDDMISALGNLDFSELTAISEETVQQLDPEQKTEPSKHIEFKDNPLAHSVFNGYESSISQTSSVVNPTENRATYSTKSDEQEEKIWKPYIIADLKTWADSSSAAAPSTLEHFDTFEEAKARFDELRSQPYNSEETRNADGRPYARLTLGIETKNGAADVIHVRAGQNYLVDDFTRQPSILSNSSAMELINRAESEIGFDRVFSFKKLDNGSYDNGTDLSFSDWNNENHIFAEQPQQKFPTITCDWSESFAFEEGKTYSALEFDTIMKREDEDWISKRQQELKAFGGDINKLYEAREKGELKVHHQGYAKTHFTVNMPNGTSYSERQDIGDGYGGVIDFLDRFGYKHVAEELKKAANAELSEKFRAQAEERVNSSQENNSFHITDETDIGTGGLKTKFQNNIAAITTLKTIESESRSATPEEQKILAKYVGWGGIPQAFDHANEQWSKEYKQLRELLTDDEYKAAAESTLNAHYTSPEIIGAMYKALNNFGFNGGNVLEPAMGVGNFFGCMPESMNNDSRLYGVELDSLTGRIAQQLYPQADIRVQGFEKSDFPDNFFDAAIGNVPFGNYGVADRRYDKEHFLIHDYFFAKTLDKVAPGGVVAFVTSKGTLDKKNSKVREYLAKRADLIGAIRLPNNAFKNANTEVTSDIIFLQKREKMAVEMPDWAYTGRNSDGMPINQYFIDHPDMVLGKLEYTTGAYGQEVTCTPIEGEKLSEQLDRAVAKLRADMKVQKREERQDKERGIIPATADVQNFTHTLVDGKLYFRENNVMTEVKQTGKDLERMKGLHGLRQTLRELIDAQSRSCSDEELHGLQAKLNTQYDSFKKEYGSINDRLNANVFRCDDDYNTLCSLEIVNAEKKTTQKSDIFTQRTIKPTVDVTHVETPQEAMQVSLDMKGRIDISYMAQLCDREPEQVVNELVQSNQIYLNPEKYVESEPLEGYEESSEYLSGNVREKLRAAERAAKDNPELFGRNVAGLTDNLPKTIGAGDITTHLGASWIDVRDYERFLKEYIGRDLPGVTLRRTSAGEYKVENKTFDKSVAATNTYGTERMSAYHIFENLLNHRDVTVKDRVDLGEDKYKYVVNTKQTQLATEKARQMNEAFSKWVWAKPERRDKYVTRYNELFNSIVGRHFDGSHQTFPGMSPYIQLKPHQKDAVARAKFGGNTLLAHCVGAGKSFEMIAATMEKKRLGLINKACVVVPKALVGQTANEWLRLYPQAKILVAGDNDFSKDNRQKFIGRCCTGDYAAVVMSYEQFEKIQMSVEYRQQFLQRELDRIQSGIKELNPYLDKTSIKDLQREQKRIKVKIEKLLDTAKTKDTSLTFEQLGFDSLVVDEAHNYKNGLVVSKMNNVSGVQTTAAQKSEDILMKTQYLNETYGTKNILFATGTPVTNSMTELYTMQRYLRPDLLDRARLQTFDDWAGNFGEVVSQLELKPAGDGFRTKKRFAKFTNLPELMQMYKEFADIRTADMLKLDVPELEGGKPQTIVAKPNDFQKAYMQVLAQRSEDIHSGSIDPTVDNMLKVTHEARLLGLDARAINPEAENTPDSKVNLCIDKVMEIYKNTEEQKGVQAIFCDIAVNSTDGKFSVYDYIKEELQRRGIPANEICTAGDAKDQNQRNEMFSQLRAGQKRIVLASTSKLGTGANIQTRLAALHNLDIPWKPSDLEQRNGRIIRQGNQFGKVGVFNYVTENTFDAYMMNIIVTKQKFISQLMSGKTPARTCEDVDDMVLNYSEMQALATGDPRIKEKIELDTEVSRLRTLESEHYNNQYKLEDVILNRKTDLKGMQQRVEFAKGDKAFAEEQLAKSDEFSVKLDGKIYTERSEAGEVLAKEIVQCMARHEEKTLGEYKGFEVSINTMSNPVSTYAQVNLKRFGGLTYSAQVELDNNLGNITRMENLLKNGIDKEIARCEERIERDTSDIKAAEETLAMPFALADELQQKVARLDQLNAELDCGKNDEVFLNDDNDREEEKPSRSQGIKPDTPSARPKR